MTFTYSATSLSTDLAKLRLAIGDTTSGAGPRPNAANFSDEELAVFTAAIPTGGTWRNAVAPVLRVLANQYAAEAKRVSDPEVSEDLTQTARELRQQAANWEGTITALGASSAAGAMTAGVVTYGDFVYEVTADGTVV